MKDILVKLNEKIDHFQENASSHVEKMNKAAGVRARKLSLELEKKLKEFRKASLEREKAREQAKQQ